MLENLSRLPVGETARVVGTDETCSMQRRLLDLGFTEGAHTRCLYENPSGNPRAYLVRGTVIALRNEDAACVQLEEE